MLCNGILIRLLFFIDGFSGLLDAKPNFFLFTLYPQHIL